MQEYKQQGKLGEGTFGTVFKCQHIETGKIVAIKKIRLKSLHAKTMQDVFLANKQVLYEAKSWIYLSANCDAIVRCFEAFASESNLCLVLEYMNEGDLSDFLQRQVYLDEVTIKTMMRMIFTAIAQCHEHCIMHRDIKPANFLLDSHGNVKLGDFGLATVYRGRNKTYSHCVASRFYRAPELLYGSQNYDTKIDIWSAGCILAEMYNRCPLFAGETDIDQLRRVVIALSMPNESIWPGVSKLPDFGKISFTGCNDPVPFKKLVPNASKMAIDLLQNLLCYDPEKRLSAEEALKHPYFHSDPLPLHPSQLVLSKKAVPRFSVLESNY